jgi:hypothetical protein
MTKITVSVNDQKLERIEKQLELILQKLAMIELRITDLEKGKPT